MIAASSTTFDQPGRGMSTPPDRAPDSGPATDSPSVETPPPTQRSTHSQLPGRPATRSSPAAPAVVALERTTFSSIAWSPSRSGRAGAGLFATPRSSHQTVKLFKRHITRIGHILEDAAVYTTSVRALGPNRSPCQVTQHALRRDLHAATASPRGTTDQLATALLHSWPKKSD